MTDRATRRLAQLRERITPDIISRDSACKKLIDQLLTAAIKASVRVETNRDADPKVAPTHWLFFGHRNLAFKVWTAYGKILLGDQRAEFELEFDPSVPEFRGPERGPDLEATPAVELLVDKIIEMVEQGNQPGGVRR